MFEPNSLEEIAKSLKLRRMERLFGGTQFTDEKIFSSRQIGSRVLTSTSLVQCPCRSVETSADSRNWIFTPEVTYYWQISGDINFSVNVRKSKISVVHGFHRVFDPG